MAVWVKAKNNIVGVIFGPAGNNTKVFFIFQSRKRNKNCNEKKINICSDNVLHFLTLIFCQFGWFARERNLANFRGSPRNYVNGKRHFRSNHSPATKIIYPILHIDLLRKKSHPDLSWSFLWAGTMVTERTEKINGREYCTVWYWLHRVLFLDRNKKLEKNHYYIAWKSADWGKAFLSLVAAMRKFLAGTLRLALVEIMDEMATLQEKINIITQIST